MNHFHLIANSVLIAVALLLILWVHLFYWKLYRELREELNRVRKRPRPVDYTKPSKPGDHP